MSRVSGGQATLGSLAVDWFFVLSGLLIARSWERSRTLWSFLSKRLSRVFPGYLVAVAVCLFVVVPFSGSEEYRTFDLEVLQRNIGPILALRGLNVPDAFAHNPRPGAVNGSLWSISYEFWCYIGVIVLGSTTMLRRRRLLLGCFVVSLAMSWAFVFYRLVPGGKILGTIFGYPPYWARLLPFFLSGILAHLFQDRLAYHRKGASLAVIGLAIGACVPCAFTVLLPTLGTYLVLYLAFTRDWHWPGAASRGDFSYGIYLYAYPIQQLITMRLGRPASPYLLFVLALVPVVAAGVLSWWLVERHFVGRRCRPEG